MVRKLLKRKLNDDYLIINYFSVLLHSNNYKKNQNKKKLYHSYYPLLPTISLTHRLLSISISFYHCCWKHWPTVNVSRIIVLGSRRISFPISIIFWDLIPTLSSEFCTYKSVTTPSSSIVHLNYLNVNYYINGSSNIDI